MRLNSDAKRFWSVCQDRTTPDPLGRTEAVQFFLVVQTQSSGVIHQLQIISAFLWDLVGGTERSRPPLNQTSFFGQPFANGSPAHQRDDSCSALVNSVICLHLFIYPAWHYCTADFSELAREYVKYENAGFFIVLTIFQYRTEASVVQCQLSRFVEKEKCFRSIRLLAGPMIGS